jgi:hypothetical protein
MRGVICIKCLPGPFYLDSKGKPGGFEPFLTKYLRLGELIVGLATGSIVLLIGSSALHGQSGILPWYYTSPLLLLAVASCAESLSWYGLSTTMRITSTV